MVPAHLVFSPDGRWLAGAGQARQLCLWDVTTGTLLWQLPPQSGPAIERFAFSANSLCLATVNADHTVTLYDAVTGAQRGRLGEADPKKRTVHLTFGTRDLMQMRRDLPVCLAFSPDGRYLATAKDTPEIHLWDVLAGREVGLLKGHEGGVVSLLFSADGNRLFSGGTDTTALTWDLTRLTRPESARRGSPDSRRQAATAVPGRAVDRPGRQGRHPGLRRHPQAERLSRPGGSADPGARATGFVPVTPNAWLSSWPTWRTDRVELRRQAESELEGLGDLAEPALRKALDGDPPLVLRQRVERLLDKLIVPTAGQMREPAQRSSCWRLMGSPDARQVLQSLADGVPGTRLTREARGAMQRLTKQAGKP